MMEHHTRLEKFLRGADYPMTKANLVTYAEQYGVEQQISQKLLQLPERQFETPNDVLCALGMEPTSTTEPRSRTADYNGNIPQGGKGESV